MSSSRPSSSPSFPSPLSPFSRLPNELVQTIIDSTTLRHYRANTYSSRRSTLYSLCLVSKLFHQIAKPLLNASMEVTSFTPKGRWYDSSKDGLRSLVCDFSYHWQIKSNDLNSLVRSCSQLRKLTLSGRNETIEMYILSQLKNLAHLKFHGATLSSSNSFDFPNVTIFDLYATSWAESSSETINSTTFPALSALSIAYQEIAIKEVSHSVGPQLDAFFTSWNGFPEDQMGLLQDKTLFNIYLTSEIPLPAVKYLRIYGGFAKLPKLLEYLLKLLRQSSPKVKPSLIYLPSSTNLDLSAQNKVYVELKSEWEKAGIEITFEEQPGDWRLDSAISYDFWARMRKAKKEENFT